MSSAKVIAAWQENTLECSATKWQWGLLSFHQPSNSLIWFHVQHIWMIRQPQPLLPYVWATHVFHVVFLFRGVLFGSRSAGTSQWNHQGRDGWASTCNIFLRNVLQFNMCIEEIDISTVSKMQPPHSFQFFWDHFDGTTGVPMKRISAKKSSAKKSLTWLSVCCNTMKCHLTMHYALYQLSTSGKFKVVQYFAMWTVVFYS